ncbi:serine protease [Leptospira ryugenii]|uniref:Serine protease n=1 Tax=Leptospira ryugenii TaxID=1917863 RepID=A0A2P2DYZ5_9LEPT|nr:signal peptide peptidase SppA [Leptospira ryugenii]GBF49816.1 serine protease [Leptospira ryugenii]
MSLRKHFLISLAFLFLSSQLQNCIIGPGAFGASKPNFEEKLISGKGKDKILLIPIEGVISDESREATLFGGGRESLVATVKESLKFAERDKQIKGIILKINSPGGTVTASDIIYEEIDRFRKKTGIPVFSIFMDTAASGAYYIAMATDFLGAHPTTVTGSVGVIMQNVNVKEGLDKLGIKDQSYTSGPNKALGSPLIETSPEQKRILQSIVDNLFDRFFKVVKKGRPNVPESRLKEICDGRIFTAEQAKKEGMVDAIGYFDDFVLQMTLHPKYQGDRTDSPRIIIYQRGSTRLENVYMANEPNNNPSTLTSIEGWISPKSSARFFYLWDI